MNELALFAGAGGGILGGHLLGWRTVCAVEWDPYAASVLVARQNDGTLPPFPIWDDVQTFDGHPWRGRIDVISGGFPCQDISQAGTAKEKAGIEGERSGMWKHMARIIKEVCSPFVFIENSPLITYRGLTQVLYDLASLGYDAKWGVLGATEVGAPHQRDRIWIIASNTNNKKEYDCPLHEEMAKTSKFLADHEPSRPNYRRWIEPNVGRLAHGVAHRVDRLKATGNGQVPAVAALAWKILGNK